jgi:hypothetical protein
VRTDLILEPGRYDGVPVYTLLEAAGRGYVAIDHRFLHAILDHPEKTIPDLVRFADDDHPDLQLALEEPLLDIFRYLKTPDALPFLIGLVLENVDEVSDELVEAFAQLGAAAVDPLLQLLRDIPDDDHGDVPFLLSVLRVRDPRILEALTQHLAYDTLDATVWLQVYGDPAAIPAMEQALRQFPPEEMTHKAIRAAITGLSSRVPEEPEPPEPFDIWEHYPEVDSPPMEDLSEDEHLAMLDSPSPELRGYVALFYRAQTPPQKVRARLLDLARHDPDVMVRGECWEALGDIADEPEVRKAMLGVLRDPQASNQEKAGAAVALAQQSDNVTVFKAIEELYADVPCRAKALKAMARSFDRRFAAYPPKHLDDPDAETKRQAIWGIGYLNLPSEAPRLEAFFDIEEFRSDALFAYALSVPGDTSRGRIRALLKKVDEVAGGFTAHEEELVLIALDQRLMLHGMKPVFFSEEDEAEEESAVAPAMPAKPSRNDPCPCGSGKKYKKCCGA